MEPGELSSASVAPSKRKSESVQAKNEFPTPIQSKFEEVYPMPITIHHSTKLVLTEALKNAVQIAEAEKEVLGKEIATMKHEYIRHVREAEGIERVLAKAKNRYAALGVKISEYEKNKRKAIMVSRRTPVDDQTTQHMMPVVDTSTAECQTAMALYLENNPMAKAAVQKLMLQSRNMQISSQTSKGSKLSNAVQHAEPESSFGQNILPQVIPVPEGTFVPPTGVDVPVRGTASGFDLVDNERLQTRSRKRLKLQNKSPPVTYSEMLSEESKSSTYSSEDE